MLDALHPALQVLQASLSDLQSTNPGPTLQRAAAAAEAGAAATRTMRARAGRASYVAQEKVTQEDPGAVAAAAWFTAVSQALS